MHDYQDPLAPNNLHGIVVDDGAQYVYLGDLNNPGGNIIIGNGWSGIAIVNSAGDHIIHGKTGLLFDADDPEALLAAIQYMLDHEEERIKMSNAAQKHLKAISWQKIFGQLMTDYASVVEEPPAINQFRFGFRYLRRK